MAASFNFELTICVLVITRCLAEPAVHGQEGQETFKITVSVAPWKHDPTWIVNNDTTDTDVKTIYRFLKEIGHSLKHQTKKSYTLPDVMGYRGIEIHHTSATENHRFVIPKCKFLKLEYLIVSRTSGSAMTVHQKKITFETLKKCLKNRKAAAEAAKLQTDTVNQKKITFDAIRKCLRQETFKITVSVAPGKQDSTWIIANDTTYKDTKTIIRLLKAIGRGLKDKNIKYTMPDVMGYRGMEIDHTSSTENHSFVIPKCKFLILEYLIVSRTSGSAMTVSQKKITIEALKKCLKNRKAAAEAAKLQTDTAATQKPTATKL